MSNRQEQYQQLREEAITMLQKGYEPDDLAHVIWYPDGTLCGLSTPLPFNADLRGLTERYYTILQFVEGTAKW